MAFINHSHYSDFKVPTEFIWCLEKMIFGAAFAVFFITSIIFVKDSDGNFSFLQILCGERNTKREKVKADCYKID